MVECIVPIVGNPTALDVTAIVVPQMDASAILAIPNKVLKNQTKMTNTIVVTILYLTRQVMMDIADQILEFNVRDAKIMRRTPKMKNA